MQKQCKSNTKAMQKQYKVNAKATKGIGLLPKQNTNTERKKTRKSLFR